LAEIENNFLGGVNDTGYNTATINKLATTKAQNIISMKYKLTNLINSEQK
jgi:hypothetical protein